MKVKRMSNALYHHGIDGQKWGVRNGPPYPLDSGSGSSGSKKKKKHKSDDISSTKKNNDKFSNQNTISKQEKKAIIYSGDPKKVSKIQHTLTEEEYKTALHRIDMNKSLSSYDNTITDKKLTTYAKAAAAVTATAVTTQKILSLGESILGKRH